MRTERSRPPGVDTGSPSPPPTSGSTAWSGQAGGRLDEELERLGRIPLIVVDEVGYIPFDPEAAALFFALICSATSAAR